MKCQEKNRRTEAGCPQRGGKKENPNFLIRIEITPVEKWCKNQVVSNYVTLLVSAKMCPLSKMIREFSLETIA